MVNPYFKLIVRRFVRWQEQKEEKKSRHMNKRRCQSDDCRLNNFLCYFIRTHHITFKVSLLCAFGLTRTKREKKKLHAKCVFMEMYTMNIFPSKAAISSSFCLPYFSLLSLKVEVSHIYPDERVLWVLENSQIYFAVDVKLLRWSLPLARCCRSNSELCITLRVYIQFFTFPHLSLSVSARNHRLMEYQ